jgi:AraC-like DNA-binding protein
MNQFLLQKGSSKELEQFAHIIEFAIKKNNAIQLSTVDECTNCIRIYYVLEGKFEWTINDADYILYPGDLVLIQPGCRFSRQTGVLDIGKLCWICIELEKTRSPEGIMFGKWSSFPVNEILTIGKILRLCNTPVISRIKEAERILTGIRYELFYQQVGYVTRTNQLIDELVILLARKLTLNNNTHRDFPKSFLNLEQNLRQNLSHQWTVEEMAALVGLGTTTFTEKVKSYSGFTPLNYLITIRISEAIKLLKQNHLSVTNIALDVGFYSSQHFSTTFKKLTGFTPSDFRKKNISNEQD